MATDTNLQTQAPKTQPVERVRGGRTYRPNVDIFETSDEIVVLADVPGASAKDIDINYDNGLLTISANVASRQTEGMNFLRREYGVGDFYRTFRIGEGIDAQTIEAKVASGVLTLHLPKAEQARRRKITVKTA